VNVTVAIAANVHALSHRQDHLRPPHVTIDPLPRRTTRSSLLTSSLVMVRTCRRRAISRLPREAWIRENQDEPIKTRCGGPRRRVSHRADVDGYGTGSRD
jgi:hypothetical protein